MQRDIVGGLDNAEQYFNIAREDEAFGILQVCHDTQGVVLRFDGAWQAIIIVAGVAKSCKDSAQ